MGAIIHAQEQSVPHSIIYPDENAPFPYIEPSQVGVEKDKLESIRHELLKWVINGDLVGGELLILKGKNTILHETYGWLNKEEKKPVEANSVWYIRSLSKPITATAIFLLQEEKKLSLDDKILQFYPDFAGDPRTTIADLLSHRAGFTLKDNDDNFDLYENIEAYSSNVAAHKPSGNFGEYGYDNTGYAILAGIIEQVTEDGIEQYIEERIFNVLEMNDSYTNIPDDLRVRNRLNTWYKLHPFSQEYYVSMTHMRPAFSYYLGLSGILSTVTDYAKFMSVYRRKEKWKASKLLTNTSVNKMMTLHGFADRGPFEVGFGYGWWLNVDHDNPKTLLNYGHEGGDEFIAYVYPKDDLTILFFTSSKYNRISGSVKELLSWSGLVKDSKTILSTSVSKVKDSVSYLTAEMSQAYTGSYLGPRMTGNMYPLIKVAWRKDRLIAQITILGNSNSDHRDLFYIGNDRFMEGRYFNDKPDWVNPGFVFKFNDNEEQNKSLALVTDGQIMLQLKQVHEDSVQLKAKRIKKYRLIDNVVRELIQNQGLSEAKEIAQELHKENPDTILFTEDRLNSLGYRYIEEKKYNEAITTFEINTIAYPESPNCYDSLADAWKRSGNYVKSKAYYEKALNLAQKQKDSRAPGIEKRLRMVNELINKQKK